jgi:predicted nucleic acid-binding protein
LILLSDANILIDLGAVNGLAVLARIAPTEVLDVTLEEVVIDERFKHLRAQLTQLSITEVVVPVEWRTQARKFKSSALSVQDALALHYASTAGRVLLTTDAPLRARASANGVQVHGSLWLVEQCHTQNLCSAAELCRWLKEWQRLGSRLPRPELTALMTALGCH